MQAIVGDKQLLLQKKKDLKSINDSITQLILSFQFNQDSMDLELALALNDKVIALDSLNKNQFYNLNTRILILGLLNRNKEASLLKEKTLSKDKYDIDRLIYYGLRYNLEGQRDSSAVYFNEAIVQCDKLLNNTIDANIVIKKMQIYVYQDKIKEAKSVLNKALKISPDDQVLLSFKENFDEYYKKSHDFLKTIKL